MKTIKKIILLSLLSGPLVAQAATYYVATSGNDSANGSSSTPWKTLQHAAGTVVAGDTVIVRAGTYVGFHFENDDNSGTAANPITFKADPGVKITSHTPGANGNEGLINIEVSSVRDGYYIIDGFEVDGSADTGRGIRMALSRHNIVRNCVVHGAEDTNIFANTCDFLLVENNICYNAQAQHGIYVNGTDSYIIRGNICYGNNWNGIHTNVQDGSNQINSHGLIENNIVRDNQLAGMDLDGMNTGIVRNNLSYGNGRHGIVIHNGNSNPTYASHDNLIVNNTFDARAGSSAYAIEIAALAAQPAGSPWTGNDINTTIMDNILLANTSGGNGSIGDLGTVSSTLKSDYNIVVDRFQSGGTSQTLAQWRSATGEDANSIIATAAQLFVNPSTNDLHLKLGAPAINAGTDYTNMPATDFDGNQRVQGAAVDMGAYEFASGGGPNIFYVATNGSDSANGSSATPWKTLQHAADTVAAGDTVNVRAGNFAGFHMTISGTSTKRITFTGESGAVVNTRNPTTTDGLNLEGASFVTIQGFAIKDIPRAGIRSVGNDGVIIRNNSCDNSQMWGIFTGFSENVLIENNVITNTRNSHGIYVSNSADNPIVRGNNVSNSDKCGLQINADVSQGGDGIITNALVENNIFTNNALLAAASINFDGVQNSIFRNNIIYTTKRNGIAFWKNDAADACKNNWVVGNTIVFTALPSGAYYAINISGGSTGNKVLDNVIYREATNTYGSIGIDNSSRVNFQSDYNVVVDRFNLDPINDTQPLLLSEWRTQTGQDAHSIMATPTELFVDATNGDFRLKSGSPAINAGTSLSQLPTDILGTSRSSAGAPDIGAYEFAGGGNQAPTVATAAAANPSPVTGTTTNLSVLGDDDNGELALKYTWATTGTPPAAVNFSINGTNVAKNSVATFTKAGAYKFQVTIKDAGGLSVTSSVNVTVNQTLNSITVTPASASVKVNNTRQFAASAKDQFGASMTSQPSFAWGVSGGGTIDSSGLFTAGATAGGPFAVNADAGGRSGTASVTVTVSNPPTVATKASATPNPLVGIMNTKLSVLGADDGGEAALIYTWAVTGTPPGSVNFSANGTNASKSSIATFAALGIYDLQVTIKDGDNLTVTSIVKVTVKKPSSAVVNVPLISGHDQPMINPSEHLEEAFIAFEGPDEANIFDITGKLVDTERGTNGARWDGRDKDGQKLPSGVYPYRLKENNKGGKLVIVR